MDIPTDPRDFKVQDQPTGWTLTVSNNASCTEVAALMAAFDCTATLEADHVALVPRQAHYPKPTPDEVLAIYSQGSGAPAATLRTLVLRDGPPHGPASARRQ